jgi:hypothetical protein
VCQIDRQEVGLLLVAACGDLALGALKNDATVVLDQLVGMLGLDAIYRDGVRKPD